MAGEKYEKNATQKKAVGGGGAVLLFKRRASLDGLIHNRKLMKEKKGSRHLKGDIKITILLLE